MIVSRTPFRVSLFGGGTDYPTWSRRYGGAVLGMAIDKYCQISLRRLPPFFEHRHRIVHSAIENVNAIEEIHHPAVRGILADFGLKEGVELHHEGDLPARTGLGSSSAFTVGVLKALHALNGQMISKRRLAEAAIRIEHQVLQENVGCQDQIWAAYGGLNRIDFTREGGFSVLPLVISPDRRRELTGNLLLVFTGISRIASEVAKDQIARQDQNEAQLTAMRRMVDVGEAILTSSRESIATLGDLLHESWMLKRTVLSRVSTERIDEIYETARAAGARGGKLLGAGGGGFMLFLVEPSRRKAVKDALRGLIQVKFDIDTHGSHIAVYEPDVVIDND